MSSPRNLPTMPNYRSTHPGVLLSVSEFVSMMMQETMCSLMMLFWRHLSRVTSAKSPDSCASSAYYKDIQDVIKSHYILYSNGFEWIMQDGENGKFRCPHDVPMIPPHVPYVNDIGVKLQNPHQCVSSYSFCSI